MGPKQRDKEGETFAKSLKLYEIHSNNCSSRSSECICKSRIDEQGFLSSHKAQESVCLILILYKKVICGYFSVKEFILERSKL